MTAKKWWVVVGLLVVVMFGYQRLVCRPWEQRVIDLTIFIQDERSHLSESEAFAVADNAIDTPFLCSW